MSWKTTIISGNGNVVTNASTDSVVFNGEHGGKHVQVVVKDGLVYRFDGEKGRNGIAVNLGANAVVINGTTHKITDFIGVKHDFYPNGMFPEGLFPEGLFPEGLFPNGLGGAPGRVGRQGQPAPMTMPAVSKLREVPLGDSLRDRIVDVVMHIVHAGKPPKAYKSGRVEGFFSPHLGMMLFLDLDKPHELRVIAMKGKLMVAQIHFATSQVTFSTGVIPGEFAHQFSAVLTEFASITARIHSILLYEKARRS